MKTKIVMIALVVAAAVAMTVYAGGTKTSDKCSNCASCGSCSDEACPCSK